MDTVKRDFNGAAHFFLGLSMFAVIMAIITNAMNISNYKFFGFGNTDTLIIEIVMDVLIVVAGILTFMKKPYGLIALTLLFIIRMFATVNYASSLSIAGQLGGKTALLIRDFGLFAIAMCFKKNGISGWKSMLASEEYVIAHTRESETTSESIAEPVVNDTDHLKPEDDSDMPAVNNGLSLFSDAAPIQQEEEVAPSPVIDNPIVAEHKVTENNKQKDNRPRKSPFTSLPKWAKIAIASCAGIIAVFAIIATIVATKSYPDYVSSFGEKWRYTFNLPNDGIVHKLMDGIHGDNLNGYIIVEFSDGDVVGYSKNYYYNNRIDIHREWRPIQIHTTTKEIASPQDIKIGKIYACTDSEYENWEIIPKEDADELKDAWIEELKEPTDSLEAKVFEVEPYDYEASLKKEMSIADIAATIPVKSIDVMDEVGGYFYGEENYSKAADYYRSLLNKHPNNPAIKGRLALSLTRGGDFEDARLLAEEALNKDPKELTALTALTLIEAENYNWGEVKKWAKKAIDYGSENSNVYYAYCEALYKQGEIKAAHEYYNKAYELYRNNPRREKFSEYAGCPFEVLKFHYTSFKSTQSKTNIIIPLDEKLVSSKCYYIGFQIDVNFLRYDNATIGVKIYCNNKLKTGTPSRDGFTYFANIGWYDPGKTTIRLDGWGNNSGGAWSAGQHRIELWYKGEKIAEDSFQIY